MYKISLPVDMNEVRYGIRFVRGVGVTADDRIAQLLHEKGFNVEEIQFEAPVQETPEQKAVTDMTVPELKAYAKENGIDLGEAKLKDEILCAIIQPPVENGSATPVNGELPAQANSENKP